MKNEGIRQKIDRDLAKYSLGRMTALTFYCFLIYPAFGCFSIGLIQKFSPDVTLLDNLWPRLIFVSIPFFCLYLFLKRSPKSEDFKMSLWCIAFSILNAISACVYVWKIALVAPDIILYFNSVNNLIFVCTAFYLGLPKKNFVVYFFSWCLFFFAPLMFLTWSNNAVFQVVMTDFMVDSATLFFLKQYADRSYQEPIKDKFVQRQFIDEDVSRAFEQGADLDSLSGRKDLFILQLDIRGYSDFLNAHDGDDELLLSFSRDLNVIMRGNIKIYGGKIHKTAGDGYLCLFVDQSSTDEIGHLEDMGDATMSYRQNQLRFIIRAFRDIQVGFQAILYKHGLQDMWVCGAIHFGQALFAFFGDSHRLEYDVVSKNLALAARLEEFTKRLQLMVGHNHYLVLSEEAWKYFVETHDLYSDIREHEFSGIDGDKIRSFENIERVYYMTFSKLKKAALKAS